MIEIKRILDFLNTIEDDIEITSNITCSIDGISPLSDSKKGTLTWMKDEKYDLSNVKADVIICPKNFQSDYRGVLIKVNDPKLCFIRVVEKFFALSKPKGIHPRAIIEQGANIGANVYIGANTYIGSHVSIGDNTAVYHNVTINDYTVIGRNCIIYSGAVIGHDGFGYEKNIDGIYERFPHCGGVEIGNNVEIGANTCIDRGTIGNTVIKDGVKIDNLCHIAHNVTIEKDCVVIANSMVGGSVHIGKNAWIAPSASIRNGLTVGRNSMIGLGAVVTQNVDANVVVTGVPAKYLRSNE